MREKMNNIFSFSTIELSNVFVNRGFFGRLSQLTLQHINASCFCAV